MQSTERPESTGRTTIPQRSFHEPFHETRAMRCDLCYQA